VSLIFRGPFTSPFCFLWLACFLILIAGLSGSGGALQAAEYPLFLAGRIEHAELPSPAYPTGTG
jgi:hypothetical protein